MNTPLRLTLSVAGILSLAACATDGVQSFKTPEIAKSSSLNNSGFERMQARDYAGAKPYFTQALSVEPNLAIAHLNLGAVYQNTGNPAAASEEYHLAIADDTAANGYPVVTQTTDGTTGTVTEIANRNLGRIHTRGVAGSE